jgi:Flp pilus assembly protein TadG
MSAILRRLRAENETGSSSVEMVILAPVFVFLILLAVAFGRTGMAELSVQSAAVAAAREASLASTSTGAQTNAQAMAQVALANAGVDCASLSVTIDSSGINAPLGTVGTVSASVTCALDLSDITVPGIPGTRVITSTQASPVDPFKERE